MANDLGLCEEGIALLTQHADRGNGHAANNLATALSTGIGATAASRQLYSHYMAIARASGFLAQVATDPGFAERCDSEDST